METAIIFANRKTTVRELNKSLQRHGFASGEIHGDMDQSSRLRELERFKAGDINILVASDVAARGLDIKGVSHVFNFDTPWHPDDYVHRIGRTGRAGAKGRAFTFVADEDAEAIANVEKLTGSAVPVFGKKDVRVDLKPVSEPSEEARSDDRSDDRGDSHRDEGERKPRRARRGRDGDDRDDARENSSRTRSRDGRDSERDQRKSSQPRASRGRDVSNDPPSKPGEWNGPIPSFLDVSALPAS